MPKVQKQTNQSIVLIKKSNNLVESRYKFDIWETRFFLSILSKIQKENTQFQVYRIRYKDVIKTFGLKSGDAYASLRDAAKSLMRKTVLTSYYVDGVKREQELNLITKIDYMTDEQIGQENHEYIDVMVHDEMKPYLLQLSKNFTAYDLRNVAALGVYSIRLYELLKQYESIGSRTLKIDDMKIMFELTTEYPKYNDFYRWVIKPSEVEINKHTDLLITDIEKLKEGRKVVALRFTFRAKTAQELEKIRGKLYQNMPFTHLPEPEIIELSPKFLITGDENWVEKDKKPSVPYPIEEAVTDTENATAQEKLMVELSPIVVMQFGVSFKMFMNLVEQHTEGVIKQAILVTEKAIQAGKVENKAGFFVQAVRNNYQDTEQDKQKIEAEQRAQKQAKMDAAKKMEQEVQQQKEQIVRDESKRKIKIIEGLIQTDSLLLHQAIAELRRGISGASFDPTIPIGQVLETPMLAGKLMNILQKIEPTIFSN